MVHTNASSCNTQKKKKGRKNIAISIRTSATAAKVVIFLVKLRFLFPLLRAIRCPRHETGSGKKQGSRIRNDRAKLRELALDPIHSWSTAADSCPPSDFSDHAANFDFHDKRPKMADLKSVYTGENIKRSITRRSHPELWIPAPGESDNRNFVGSVMITKLNVRVQLWGLGTLLSGLDFRASER